MSESAPLVSIIVINYNTPQLTASLIDSVRRYCENTDYEIIVLDNNSRTGLKFGPYLAADLVVYHLSKNLGFAKAANLGADKARGKLLLFANSDCELKSDLISPMAEYLNDNEEIAACSPRLVGVDGTPHSSIRRFPDHRNIRASRGSFLRSKKEYTLEAEKKRKTVEAMAATFMMIRRRDFELVGGFDERFFMYAEDTDLCRKLADRGRQIAYLGEIEVTHHWGASTRTCPLKMRFTQHASIRKYFSKHYPRQKVKNMLLTMQLVANLFINVALDMVRKAVGK